MTLATVVPPRYTVRITAHVLYDQQGRPVYGAHVRVPVPAAGKGAEHPGLRSTAPPA